MTDSWVEPGLAPATVVLSPAAKRRLLALTDGLGPDGANAPAGWMADQVRLRVVDGAVEVTLEYGGSGQLTAEDAARYAPAVAAAAADGVTAYADARFRRLPDDDVEVVVDGRRLSAVAPELPRGRTGVNRPLLAAYVLLLTALVVVAVVTHGASRVVAAALAGLLLFVGGALFGTGLLFTLMGRSIDNSMARDRFRA